MIYFKIQKLCQYGSKRAQIQGDFLTGPPKIFLVQNPIIISGTKKSRGSLHGSWNLAKFRGDQSKKSPCFRSVNLTFSGCFETKHTESFFLHYNMINYWKGGPSKSDVNGMGKCWRIYRVIFFLTGAPLYFPSTRSHQNWLRISLSARDC